MVVQTEQRPRKRDSQEMPSALAPALTPHGSLWLNRAEDEFLLDAGLAERLENSFARGAGHGLLRLGAGEAGSGLPPSWRGGEILPCASSPICAL